MQIIPLGTNGFFPSFGRQTACYAIPYGKILIFLDAGSGLFRLAEPEGKKLLQGVNEIHLFLSHYHLDHTFGFYAAFKLFEGKKVLVFGDHKKQVFSEFISIKYFPVDYAKAHRNFQWKNLKEGIQQISSYKVAVRKQDHRGEGSLAFRLFFPNACEFSYVTDSEPDTESINFVKNTPLLLHEWEISESKETHEKKIDFGRQYFDGHVTTIGTALTAKRARVGRLVLIHHGPFYQEKTMQVQLSIARSIFPKTELARDLQKVSF